MKKIEVTLSKDMTETKTYKKTYNVYLVFLICVIIFGACLVMWNTDLVQKRVNPNRYWTKHYSKKIEETENKIKRMESLSQFSAIELEKLSRTSDLKFMEYAQTVGNERAAEVVRQGIEVSTMILESHRKMLPELRIELNYYRTKLREWQMK